MDVFEGQFIVTPDNLIFEVKGVVHPPNRVTAYLRYVPDPRGDRRTEGGQRFRKIYDLDMREKYLYENAPQYLHYDPVVGRIMQSVPVDDVVRVLDPVESLTVLRENWSALGGVKKAAVDLANRIVEVAGISWRDLGVTGSILANLESSTSDIDLVVYGELPARRVYQALRKDWNQVGVVRYENDRLRAHVRFRWGALNRDAQSIMERIEARKVLQGFFHGYEFFIRAVKRLSEVNIRYGDCVYRQVGRVALLGTIVDDGNSIFTPCEYLLKPHYLHSGENPYFQSTIENIEKRDVSDLVKLAQGDHHIEDGSPDGVKLISYRGRFCEQVVKGDIVTAIGQLEVVSTEKPSRTYLQIVLGNHPADILLPHP
ncbi:MAG: hypothetical protein ACTSX3_01655 [Candidatus Thorarchaeota archaeon]